jgi:hypothetical protein
LPTLTDPAILSDYEVDHDHYDKAPNQRCEVVHSHVLLLQQGANPALIAIPLLKWLHHLSNAK